MLTQTKKITLTAMFLALGLVLPFLTGQLQQFGSMLLPMHWPVFLCALICGWQYGAVIGFILPLVRSLLFGMPMMYPAAIAMSVEMLVYGLVSGYLYSHAKWQCLKTLYLSLFAAMILGRVAWGIMEILLLGLANFTWPMFISGAITTALPGIVLQLIFIPSLMMILHKTKMVPIKSCHNEKIA